RCEFFRSEDNITECGTTYDCRRAKSFNPIHCWWEARVASETGIAEKQNALIRKLTTVDDERVLDEVGRFLDTGDGVETLRRLDDEEMDAVLRQLLEDDL